MFEMGIKGDDDKSGANRETAQILFVGIYSSNGANLEGGE
jgi:hypothetical protein